MRRASRAAHRRAAAGLRATGTRPHRTRRLHAQLARATRRARGRGGEEACRRGLPRAGVGTQLPLRPAGRGSTSCLRAVQRPGRERLPLRPGLPDSGQARDEPVLLLPGMLPSYHPSTSGQAREEPVLLPGQACSFLHVHVLRLRLHVHILQPPLRPLSRTATASVS